MKYNELSKKVYSSLPWLTRYPIWRAREYAHRLLADWQHHQHLIIVVANHFEPSWSENGYLKLDAQRSRVDDWCRKARAVGNAVRDFDGTPFRHTNFFPAEQYDATLLRTLAELQSEGLGEVEIHLHHGVSRPDNAENLKRALVTFRDLLAEEHRCLSRRESGGVPMYAFVHGNLALGNSAGGKYCGVDSEMQILAETGCYADLTLPSAPDESQVPRINAIYECGHPLIERKPHRSGPQLRIGVRPHLPVLLTGPLVLNWRRKVRGIPIPRLDDGVLASNYELNVDRLYRWASAGISVKGRPDWIFIKLYCHGFFPWDQDVVIGEAARRFWSEMLEHGTRTGEFQIHFATAREAFNIAIAACDGLEGEPHRYRNYELQPIMKKIVSY